MVPGSENSFRNMPYFCDGRHGADASDSRDRPRRRTSGMIAQGTAGPALPQP